MKRAFKIIFAILLLICGLGIYFYPNYSQWKVQKRTERAVENYQNKYHRKPKEKNGAKTKTSSEADADAQTETSTEELIDPSYLDELYIEMQKYNEKLVANGQHLVDAWSYAQTPVDLSVLKSENSEFGFISIPDMDVTLPLYIGATVDNMAKGATVLSETSMPIGGNNTNSVIAGHRGYGGAPFFRDIESLQIGSMVYITNPWGTMAYRVKSVQIIEPTDVEAVFIQPEKDMITLLTCHPYMSNGRYRYVAYCERTEMEPLEEETQENGKFSSEVKEKTEPSEAIVSLPDSSIEFIENEKKLRNALPLILLIFAGALLLIRKKKK